MFLFYFFDQIKRDNKCKSSFVVFSSFYLHGSMAFVDCNYADKKLIAVQVNIYFNIWRLRVRMLLLVLLYCCCCCC